MKKQAQIMGYIAGGLTILSGLGIAYMVEWLGGIPSRYEEYVTMLQGFIIGLGVINVLLAIIIDKAIARVLLAISGVISVITCIGLLSGIFNLIAVSKAKKAVKEAKAAKAEEQPAIVEDVE